MKTIVDYILEEEHNTKVNDIHYDAYKLLLPYFVKMTEFEKTQETEVLHSKTLQNEFLTLKDNKEKYEKINELGIYNFKEFIYWLKSHRHIMRDVYHNEAAKKRKKEEESTGVLGSIKKAIKKVSATVEEIVLYHCDYPTKSKTTKRYKIRYISDEQREEKIKELKHEWKEKTGENISACYDILAVNYDKKYLKKN